MVTAATWITLPEQRSYIPLSKRPSSASAFVPESSPWTRMDVRLRQAAVSEGERLREIAVAAKASWGYELEQVREWAAIGDFSPGGLALKDVYVASVGEKLVGWAATIHQGEVLWLDDLWIDPELHGQGIGTQLFQHAVELGCQSGAARMEWEAEPKAMGFYETMGGRYVRDGELSVWGRVNPVMSLELS
jgi:GNAT superfamily N-acetyltransferase